MAVPAKRYK